MRNQHGIEIKMCCASCRHKENDVDGRRICKLMQIVVRQQFVCPKWAVTDGSEDERVGKYPDRN